MFIPTYKAEGQAVIQVGVSNLLSAGDKTIKGVIGNEDSSILYKNVIQGWNIANQGEKELLTFGLSAVGGKVVYSGVGSLGKVKNIIGTYLRHKSKTPTIVDIKKVPSNIINKPFDTIKAKGEGWKPPYPSDINIRKFKTNEEMKFLRVHVDKKKPTGRFLVRNKEVAHLLKKPEELRKHLGLPETPKYITEVKVPKGTEVITGRIGSQPKFGLKKESGIQYQLEKKLQEEHFTNTKSIEDFVTQNIKKK
jgi:hypothetical protein